LHADEKKPRFEDEKPKLEELHGARNWSAMITIDRRGTLRSKGYPIAEEGPW
jgi:hypothetical protein